MPGAPVEIVEGVELEWREAGLDDLRSLPDELALAVGGGRAAVTGDGADVLVVEADTARVVELLRDRRVITHGLKHPALTPAGDTAIAAYLLDPGRADYEIDDLAEETGLGLQVAADEETSALVRAAAAARRLHPRAAERLAEREMTDLYEQIELPARARCSGRWRRPASASTPTAWPRSRPSSPTRSRSSRPAATSSPAGRS